jgi:hypothetical protein
MGQQESVFGSKSSGIEYSSLNVYSLASNGESCRVEVPDATVWLQHVALKAQEPQMFSPANNGGAIPDESELKAVVLGCVSDHRTKGRQATRLEPAVSVHK